MAGVSFDDLIPAAKKPSNGVSFDDLVPAPRVDQADPASVLHALIGTGPVPVAKPAPHHDAGILEGVGGTAARLGTNAYDFLAGLPGAFKSAIGGAEQTQARRAGAMPTGAGILTAIPSIDPATQQAMVDRGVHLQREGLADLQDVHDAGTHFTGQFQKSDSRKQFDATMGGAHTAGDIVRAIAGHPLQATASAAEGLGSLAPAMALSAVAPEVGLPATAASFGAQEEEAGQLAFLQMHKIDPDKATPEQLQAAAEYGHRRAAIMAGVGAFPGASLAKLPVAATRKAGLPVAAQVLADLGLGTATSGVQYGAGEAAAEAATGQPLDPAHIAQAASMALMHPVMHARNLPAEADAIRVQRARDTVVDPTVSHAERLAAALDLMNRGKRDVRPTRRPVVTPPPVAAPDEPTATPAASAPEAPAPSPEPSQPAPPPSDLIAALTGLVGHPNSDAAPVRDFTSNVRTTDFSPPRSGPLEPPATVKLPDGHPAPAPVVTPPAPKADRTAGDGLATRVVAKTVNSKTGNPGLSRELIFRPTHDDLRTWIAANGGINPETAANLGIDPKASHPLRPGVAKAKMIAPDGMDADTVLERMRADGWLPEESPDRPSTQDPREMIFDAVHRGDRITHPLNEDHLREHAAQEAGQRAQDEALAAEHGTTVPDLYHRGEVADARAEGSPEYHDIQRPEGAAPIDGQIRVLRAKRAAGLLEPHEAHQLIDLMDQDARTAKLAGSGMRLDGVQNMTAEAEAPEPPHKAFIDLDNFKGVNDKIGHAAGDQVIGQTAELLARAFPGAVFHRGGDEFVIHGHSPEFLHNGLQGVRDELQSTPMRFTTTDGRSVTLDGVGMSYGVGENVDAAEHGLQADKQARLDAGARTERRAAVGNSSGNARRAGEHVEDPVAAEAGSVRPDPGEGGSVRSPAPAAVAPAAEEAPAEVAPKADEPAPTQAEIGDMPPVASGDENSDSVTGIKHDKVTEERALKNQDEVTYEGKRTFGEAWDTASQKLKDNPMHGLELARSILSKPRPLSAEESAALIQDRMRIKNEHEAAMLDAQHAMETGDPLAEADARTRMRMAEDALEISDRAAKASGYEQGFGLAARRMLSRRDYSMASLAVRAKVARGEAITPAEHAEIEKLSKALAEADKQIAAMKAERATARSGIRGPKRKPLDQHFSDLSAQLKAIREKDQLVPGCAA